jgi:hypothetical protein
MGGQLWAKIALNLADNPKVIGLSDSAFRAFIEAILYSRQHLTDGFLDRRVVAKRWGLDVAAELTSNDPANPSWLEVEGGFEIHHFCEYQMTNEDVERKRESQRLKGIKSGEARRAKLEPNRTKVEPNVNQNELETETETDTETDKVSSIVDDDRKTTLKANWEPSEAGIEFAKSRAPSLVIADEVQRFKDYNAANGRRMVDWEATWRTWVMNVIRFRPEVTNQPPPPKKQFGVRTDEDV